MTEPAPATAPDDSYRPISGLALAGLVVSALFAILIAASLFVGVVKGSPIFFPIAIVLVAVVGFGLSYAGYRQILSSEGTRVGVGIARLGMGLAVVSGLGYAAYSMSIGLAVATQADIFLAGEVTPDSGFLTRIQLAPTDPKRAFLEEAFLLTLPPSSRGRARTQDEAAFRKQYDVSATPDGQGHFTIFRNSMMVRMLSRGGRIEALGMREWEHDKQSFKVGRNYRLETPEGTLLVVLEAESAEGETEGQPRRWFVNFNRSGVESSTLTPLGHGVQELREQGRQLLERDWLPSVRAGRVDAAKLDKSNWDSLVRDLPEWMTAGKNWKREKLRSGFRSLLGKSTESDAGTSCFRRTIAPGRRGTIAAGGRLWFRHPLTAFLPEPGSPPVQADGWVLLQTTDALPVEKMAAPAPKLGWNVESIEIERIKLR